MNDDDRVDLSALDPLRDPAHWSGFVDSTLARVGAILDERVPRMGPLSLIAGWTRPLLVATSVAVAVLVPVEIALERREPRAEQVERLVDLSTDWARDGRQPTQEDLLRVLAGGSRP